MDEIEGLKYLTNKTYSNNEDYTTISNYKSQYSKDSVVVTLIGYIAGFAHKKKFQWHLHLQIEANFDFFDHNQIRDELMLQENLDVEVTSFLKANCNLIKVVCYLHKGFYNYHYYLSSNVIDFSEFKMFFGNVKVVNQREIKFEMSRDTQWTNLTKTLLRDKNEISSWVEYMSVHNLHP